jgi:hypothetical protein
LDINLLAGLDTARVRANAVAGTKSVIGADTNMRGGGSEFHILLGSSGLDLSHNKRDSC